MSTETLFYVLKDNEIHETYTPSEFLSDEYTTSRGTRPAFELGGDDFNIVYSVDRYTGALTELEQFETARDANLFIIDYCMERDFISYGTDDKEQFQAFMKTLEETIDDDDEE